MYQYGALFSRRRSGRPTAPVRRSSAKARRPGGAAHGARHGRQAGRPVPRTRCGIDFCNF
ncbi:protein of unassigned function [Methylobacterium oryzae CBMB20]|uniref:Protein of unassigned function n=1 Tax=Methylobacterium oryzae CBMB20 TaxID=693986 RepID=A0A089QE85_9HYPH|nr:protein of unassigned function [Methylobacterium oryzae CBMB20]